ncbi:AGAP011918-PA-like protein [Anopheles sinensis]|uniref:AGAP011918-PA-like protein n=1 Tax=Anopheles sinensis TaxID=74873 RepID=A0A084WIJ8_ANOSI|nr:AGAP011918-PA-like protein [Anopheles sinensis]
MNRYFALVVLCLAALASADESLSASPWEGRIIGGLNAVMGQFPYQVSLRTLADFHFCGGAIIGDRWILTAAHCGIGRKPTEMVAVVGALSKSHGGNSYEIREIIVHPNFNEWTQESDLAIVRTRTAMSFNSVVFPVRMARTYTPEGRAVLASGWGLSSLTAVSNQKDVMQYVALRTISNEECKVRFERLQNRIVADSSLCTFSRQTQGTCMGDSGGPLVNDGELVGLVSWGIPCAAGYPDVYVRVASFRAWISAMTGVY